MSELVLLNLDRAKLRECRLSAARGDVLARREIDALWADYDSVDIECFLCGNLVERRIFTLLLLEHRDANKSIAAPLCMTCRALPELQRMHRAFTVLKAMWSKPGGPQNSFPDGAPMRLLSFLFRRRQREWLTGVVQHTARLVA